MAVKHDHPGIAKKDPMIQTYIDATYADIDAAKLGPTVAACEKYAALDEKGASDLGAHYGYAGFRWHGGCYGSERRMWLL